LTRVHILGSGSKGNAVVLESDRCRVLIDAGFSPTTLARRMRQVDIAPESISALIVTHEHGDHIAGAAAAARRWNWPVYASAGTLGALSGRRGVVRHPVEPRRELAVEDFIVHFVRTPHDADEPLALVATARSSGVRVGVVYDLGHATPRFTAHFADLDILLLESNHDDDMLWNGRYPWVVKQRIAGPRGHLSNADAGVMARACAHRGLRHVVLCHLSENNNTPAVALRAMGSALRGSAFRGTLVAAAQDTPISVSSARSRSPRQLTLAL
jgi:phosphoribosyl 1,2-cyclic phosphodiesterase